MTRTLYEIWEDRADFGPGRLTLVTAEHRPYLDAEGGLGTDPVLIDKFWAASWEEAVARLQDHYEAQEARC